MRSQLLKMAILTMPFLSLIPRDAIAEDPRERLIHRDLEFAEAQGKSLKLDLILPAETENPPLVVWIHGGGWRAGSRKGVPLGPLTKSGYAIASVSYRLTDVAIFPAQLHDCKAAIRWLRVHADRYGFDASRIAVAGSSAGGHLAMLLGVSGDDPALEGRVGGHFEQSSAVQAIVDFFGPSDFVLRRKTQPGRALTTKSGSFALLGGVRDGKIDPLLERQASPAMHITKEDPPLLIFHGSKDKTVLLDQSERMIDAYQEAGLKAELVVVDGAGHGGKTFYQQDRLAKMVAFLKQHGF
ncbi:MAG: alpha/beta hydrolase [Planctomycetota bacterium]